MKIKTRGGWDTYASQAYLDVAPPGGASPVSTGTGYRSVEYLYTAGVNTPNYRELLAQGALIPFTPFTQFKQVGLGINEWDLYPTTWPSAGTHEYTSGLGIVLSSWYSPSMETLQALGGTYDTDPYVQAAAAKLGQGRWDALTFLAELHKVLAMFKSVGVKLLDLIRAKAKAKQYVPWDLWLEGRYGWRTLIYDIQQFTDYIINLGEGRSRRSERAGHKQTWSETVTNISSDSRRDITDTITTTYEVSLRGSVVADIEPIGLQINPLTTAWELVRFSFVVDWFINVGASLAAISFFFMNTGYVSAGGIYIKATTRHDRTSVAKTGNYFANSVGYVDSESVYQTRKPSPINYFPQLRLRVDDFKIFDLVSLVLQALQGKVYTGVRL